MAKTKTFWPYGIVISIIAVFALCVGTIIVSFDYPVEMDHFYLEKYQNVNSDINDIIAMQKEFDKNFKVELLTKEFRIGNDKNVKISIKPLAQNANLQMTDDAKNKIKQNILDLDYEILLTRPDTNAFNINLSATYSDGILVTSDIVPQLEGRWQLMVKLKIKDLVGFYKMEFLAFNE